jgi:hypothetical protein
VRVLKAVQVRVRVVRRQILMSMREVGWKMERILDGSLFFL